MVVHESNREPQHKCVGFSEILEERRMKREERNSPQPWVGRKFAVGLAVAIVSYTYYVYVARFCHPMITRESRALGGQSIGIALLVVFNLLFLMFGWSYAKVILTSPGYATDYVSKTPPPVPRPAPLPPPGPWDSEESIGRGPYHAASPSTRTYSRQSTEVPSFSNGTNTPRTPRPSYSPTHSRRNTHESTINMSQTRPVAPKRMGNTDARPRDAVPPIASPGIANPSYHVKSPPSAHLPTTGNGSNSGLPPLLFSRRPPTHPVLSPEYRYCLRDEILKPMRAHHCRACGTCILKYDHHCPWIGQCVGALNHKFFVNFLQWSSIFGVFIFASLITLVVRAATSAIPPPIDPQHIVVLVLSGIFTIFTVIVFTSQVHLILLNTTTVEQLGMERMRDRERSVLARMVRLPCSCSGTSDFSTEDGTTISPVRVLISRRKIVKHWDAEWGKIDTEGNLWWLGSRRANWEATMGVHKLGWILPIGRSLGNGLTYPTNPRFDREGRWRKRSEWPDGLR